MDLGKRIKEYRNRFGMNQDELAEKMYVTRQTISNWENDKSYPDIQSLLFLSEIFNVSLDQLVKGDIEKMEKVVNQKDVRNINLYSKIMTAGFLICLMSVIPLAIWLRFWFVLPIAAIYIPTMWAAKKVENIKKEYDIQTYREIIAFSKGEKLDEIAQRVELEKRPYEKKASPLLFAAFAIVFEVVVLLIIIIIFNLLH